MVRYLVTGGLLFSIIVGSYRLWLAGAVTDEAPRVALSVDGSWHARLGLSTSTYQTALTRAGLRYEEVRAGDGSPQADQAVRAILDRSDALLLAGGGDVAATRSHATGSCEAVDEARDAFEISLIEGALKRDMPILGICRGIQMLNVAAGGSLRALRDDLLLGPAHGGELEWSHSHSVALAKGSLFARLEGSEQKQVNSYHGQAIDTLAPTLRAQARAPDGVIEAVTRPGKTFVYGTQWHPEILSLEHAADFALFKHLAAAARDYQRSHLTRDHALSTPPTLE